METYNLDPQIIERLKKDFSMKEKGKYLRGKCPDCGKQTLWTWLASPGRIQCDNTGKCGYEENTKELYSDLYENINDKYQPTPQNPNATADAYLAITRGFDISKIKGWYEQGHFVRKGGDKSTATVRFYLDDKKKIMWQRLIEIVTITDENGDKKERKMDFSGSFAGLWWMPPTMEINENDTVWQVEGIPDAIALWLNGIKAVAIMSSGTFPNESIKPHLEKNITWVIALDNDISGRKFLQKHAKTLQDLKQTVSGALSSDNDEKVDWNDLHKAKKLKEKHIEEYLYLGSVELASSYRKKAGLIWAHKKNNNYFIFDYHNRTYATFVNKKDFDKSRQLHIAEATGKVLDELTDAELKELEAGLDDEKIKQITEKAFFAAASIREIATFKIDFLYFQQPDNDEDGQYFFRFNFSNKAPEQQLAFTGKTFGGCSDFKKAAMHKAPGAHFVGSSKDLDKMYRDWMSNVPKIVRTLDFIGYDVTCKAYVFNEFAVENGRIIKLNKESFFQLKQTGIKTMVDISQTLSDKYSNEWVGDYVQAFGTKGIVTLAWWFGALFAEQIRHDYRSYPFYELTGEPGSGKSDMVDFLWKLLGKLAESFNPNDSTLPGRTRKMSEVSNMPVVFNETDNEKPAQEKHIKTFNWGSIKDLFEGEFGRVTGIKSQDNATRKPKFKGALMAVQNPDIVAEEAILSRITKMNFDRSHHSTAGKEASDRLKRRSIEDVNGFLLHSVKQSEKVMKHFAEEFKASQIELRKVKGIKLERIIDNHAMLAALLKCLKRVIPEIPQPEIDKAIQFIEPMAVARQNLLNTDLEVVIKFWAQFDYMDGSHTYDQFENRIGTTKLNHHKDPENFIAVRLEEYNKVCVEHKQQLIDTNELRKNLPSSKARPFSEKKSMSSALTKASVRCYIFRRSNLVPEAKK